MSQYPSKAIVSKGERTKRHGLKTTGKPTKQESEWMDSVANFGCILTYFKTGISGTPCAVHHLLTGRIPGRRPGHLMTIGLAPHYHQYGPEALHCIGLEPWQALHGITEIELLKLTKELLK